MFNRVAFIFVTLSLADAFYLPGVSPREYAEGEAIEMKVNKLDSVVTQLPYDYYSLPFCQPESITLAAENLGEILAGDKIETSAYKLNMNEVVNCKILCRVVYNQEQMTQFATRIREKYNVNYIVDNIPVAQSYKLIDMNKPEQEDIVYERGFPLGFVGGEAHREGVAGTPYIYNHIRLLLYYHEDKSSYEGYRIVSFLAEPFSVKHSYTGTWAGAGTKLQTCDALKPIGDSSNPQAVEGTGASTEVIFTYDVAWKYSDIKWASRWDIYLKMASGAKVHWYSIGNSILVVLTLSTMVAVTLGRALRHDLNVYNEIDESEDPQEETGWKLIHGDVFRPPAHADWLSVLVGTGCQLTAMCFITLVFACFGFLSPANRGGLGTALLVIFVFLGALAGYQGTKMYKMFGLTEWKKNTVRIALFFPGVMFVSFFILNLLVWSQHSTAAVPFGTLVALLVLWLGISAPLVYLGSWLAFKKPAVEFPVRVNNIPKLIPPSDERQYFPFIVATAGVLPFSAVYVEIYFIMYSVWNHQFYYVFGFLGIAFLILLLTAAETSIMVTYHRIVKEDYHWWWASFFASGSSALFMLIFSVYYYAKYMQVTKFVSGALFFGNMLLVCFGFMILTGTVGFLSTFLFMRTIYGSVKID